MKRYLVFAWRKGFIQGGFNDLVCETDDRNFADIAALKVGSYNDHVEIYDTKEDIKHIIKL